jgi:succinate-acetate transporter protein
MEIPMAEVTSLRQKHESWTKAGPVVSQLDETEIAALEERATATIGDPAPMGLWAFATGTWIMGVVIAVFPSTAHVGLLPILAGFSGIAQFIAGLFAYRRANVLAATFFCSFGAFFVVVAMSLWMRVGGTLPNDANAAAILGYFYESFAFIALALGLASIRLNGAMVALLFCLCVGLALAGIPQWAGTPASAGWGAISAIGGWFMFASGIIAGYLGAALIVNSTFGRTMLPLLGEP